MKKLYVALLCLFLSAGVVAQVTNNALAFERNGRLSLGTFGETDASSGVTLQLWMNPGQWIPGANVVEWGDCLRVRLAAFGELSVEVGPDEYLFKDAALLSGNWVHLTLLLDGTDLGVLVNNANEQNASLSAPFAVSGGEPLLLGGGFLGRIDEVRLWNTLLPADYNRYWNNTIDSLNPSWKNIEGYWKFDQTRLAENVYDYSGNEHNGTFSADGVKRLPVTDNRNFVYRRNLAYSDCSRFFDRGIQQGQYLKSNVISMIGGTAQADGSIKYKQPDNAGTVAGGSYLEEYDGRTGVLDLSGEGAQMNVGKDALIAYNNNLYLETASAYTFMTWLSLDGWTPGAFLLKKESSADNGISLRLGNEQGEFVLRCNGVEFRYAAEVEIGKWHHVGFSTGAAALGSEFVFVFDGKVVAPSYSHTVAAGVSLSGLRSTDCIIGEELDGKLDETITWTQAFSAPDIVLQSGKPLEPGVGKSILGAYSRSVDGFWKYDVPEDLGRDSYSTPEWFRMIKAAFDGYEGAYVTISLDKYSDEFFTKINGNAQYREALAESIAAMGNEPFLDGVDYDFEWNNNWSGIGTLCQLVRAKLLPGKIQAVSPHELYYNFPTDKMQYVDYFNFQNYGPNNRNIFKFDNYKSFFTKAKNHGYPVDKIMLSYATTTSGALYSNGSRPSSTHAEFYPTGWRSMPYGTFAYDQNSYDVGGGLTRYFTGMEQVWLRSELMNNNGCAGIFYWDMGNDTPQSDDPRSLATFASFAINSNVQKIVESVASAAEAPAEYEVQDNATEYYRLRGASEGHTAHYLYQNGDELFAGDKGGEVRSIFSLEDAGDGTFYIKANDGRYVQDRSALASTSSVYRFGKQPVAYVLKGSEYSYPEGHYCLEQVEFTPGKQGFTDVQRCLKCNGNNEGVSTWGPWTAASHWAIEPLFGYDVYAVSLDGVESVACLIEGYTGSGVIYDGGFVAVPSGYALSRQDIDAGTAPEGKEFAVEIDTEEFTVTVVCGTPSGIDSAAVDSGPDVVYDFTGRKLKEVVHSGLYIVGGKKVFKR